MNVLNFISISKHQPIKILIKLQIIYLFQEIAFENIVCKMVAIWFWPRHVKLWLLYGHYLTNQSPSGRQRYFQCISNVDTAVLHGVQSSLLSQVKWPRLLHSFYVQGASRSRWHVRSNLSRSTSPEAHHAPHLTHSWHPNQPSHYCTNQGPHHQQFFTCSSNFISYNIIFNEVSK